MRIQGPRQRCSSLNEARVTRSACLPIFCVANGRSVVGVVYRIKQLPFWDKRHVSRSVWIDEESRRASHAERVDGRYAHRHVFKYAPSSNAAAAPRIMLIRSVSRISQSETTDFRTSPARTRTHTATHTHTLHTPRSEDEQHMRSGAVDTACAMSKKGEAEELHKLAACAWPPRSCGRLLPFA